MESFGTINFFYNFTIISKYFDMVSYTFKQEAYFAHISLEVQWSDNWTDRIQSFKLSFDLLL